MKFRDLSEPVRDLVTFLLIISLPSEKQLEVHGIGNPALEMPDYIDFPMGFDEDIEKIKPVKTLPPATVNEIEHFILQLRGNSEEFWREFKTSPDWDGVRNKAKELIKTIGLSELEIITEFNRDTSGNGVVEQPALFIVIELDRKEGELEQAIAAYQSQ